MTTVLLGRRMPAGRSESRKTRPARKPRKTRPAVEALEGRALMASGLTRFAIPTGPNQVIADLARGPDGTFWFDLENTHSGNITAFGKMTPRGKVTLFSTRGLLSDVEGVTPLADGTLWFLTNYHQAVGEVTPTGQVRVFPLPDGGTASVPFSPSTVTGLASSLKSGDDIWLIVNTMPPFGTVTSTSSNPLAGFVPQIGQFHIDRITPQGQIQEFAAPAEIPATTGDPWLALNFGLVPAPDGALWFSEVLFRPDIFNDHDSRSAFVRIDPATGQTREYSFSAQTGLGDGPETGFAFTGDGSLWFQSNLNTPGGSTIALDRLSPTGQFSVAAALPADAANAVASLLSSYGYPIADARGDVWFIAGEKHPAQRLLVKLGQVDEAGHVTTHTVTAGISTATGFSLLPGADGSMSFVSGYQSLGRVSASGRVSTFVNHALPDKYPSPYSSPFEFNTVAFGHQSPTIGRDGSFWFVAPSGRALIRYTLPGHRRGRHS